jgi:anaerobic magnesium-protoporphyrin IX monomethyl ester cyclase
MKVLLVQSYLGRYESEGPILPLGLCCIASALIGHNIQIFDPNVSDSPFIELEERVKAFKPHLVGISLRNIDTTKKRDIFYYFKILRPTVQLVKRIDPAVKVMVGGTGFSMFAKKIMERIPEIDFGIYLEGEESVPELLAKLDNTEDVKGIFIRKDGNILFTGARPFPDIEKLPEARLDLVDIKKYDHPVYTNIGIQTKRGCLLSCAYCSYPFLNGHKIRARSVKQVVDEIEYLVNGLDVRRFMFTDSVFNVPERHAEEICKEIIRRRVQVEWSAWFDLKGFSEELLTLAVEAGCKNLSFSPDAAFDASLNALNKGISEKDISRVIKMLKKTNHVRVEFNLFCTPPRQNFLGFLKTLLLFLRANLFFIGRGAVNLSWIRIEPGSRLYEIAIEEGLISKETELLPMEEKELSNIFYSCPTTRRYADPVFSLLLGLQEKIKPYLKRILVRRKADDHPY